MVRVRVDRQSLNMGDDMMSHRRQWDLSDDAPLRDLIRRTVDERYLPSSGRTPWVLHLDGGGALILLRLADSRPVSVAMLRGDSPDTPLSTYLRPDRDGLHAQWSISYVDSEVPWQDFRVAADG